MSASHFIRTMPLANSTSRRSCLIAIGNPCIDYTVVETEIRLPSNVLAARGLTKEIKSSVIQTVLNCPSKITSIGGSALNTARVAAATSSPALQVLFVGSVGKDEAGRSIEAECRRGNVEPILYKSDCHSTGQCAVIINSSTKERTMYCLRGAAGELSPEHLTLLPSQAFSDGTLVFATAYNLTTERRYETVRELSTKGYFALSLSKDVLMESPIVKSRIESLLGRTSFVFANAPEVNAFFKNDSDDIILNARKLADKLRDQHATAFITNGKDDLIVACKNGVVASFPVKRVVDGSKIVSTTGCGDSFCGGTLAAILSGDSLETSVKKGLEQAYETLFTTSIAID